MCSRSSFEHDLYERSSARPGRSLVGWLRDLWRPRPPQVQEAQEAEVVPFPAGGVPVCADQEADRRASKAA
jgi:hypothetical protein